jgi:hypothetical protein
MRVAALFEASPRITGKGSRAAQEKDESKKMTTKTNVKAGSRSWQHNQTTRLA